MEIKDKNVLITGGLGDFGSVLAESLSKEGANIYIFDINALDQPNCFRVDATDENEVQAALAEIDRIDVLINCAGEIYSEPLINFLKKERHQKRSWEIIINNNLTSCFNMSVQVAQKMAASRTKGVIINFSSISAQGNAGQAAYSAAKAGVEALTKVMAKELGMFKIRTVAIAPGFINTSSTRKSLNDALIDYWTKQTPLRQLGSMEDIVKTVKYVVECDYLSGCTINVDGGLVV